MLKFKTKGETLKTLLDAVYQLTTEVKLQSNPDGLHICAVDPAHVALIELKLSKDAFQEFQSDDRELGLDLDKLKDVLKLAGNNDEISAKYDEEKHRIVMKIGKLTRSIALIDTTNMGDPKIPDLQLPGKVTLQAGELLRALKASGDVSDHISVEMTADQFKLEAAGDTDKVDLCLDKADLVELTAPDDCRSLYSLDYFESMVSVVKAGENVTLGLGTDFPIRMQFKIANGAGDITYLLAPRIEAD